jgi:hypothetical protein
MSQHPTRFHHPNYSVLFLNLVYLLPPRTKHTQWRHRHLGPGLGLSPLTQHAPQALETGQQLFIWLT